jgi:LacI family transcriptional regulator
VTVSRVLNDASHVKPTTRERVERAIKELHYVPSVAARSLRSKRTNALALLVPDVTNPFWTTVARGVEDAALSRGYSVLLCNTDEDPGKQLRYLDVIISQRVDGAIIAPYHNDARKLKKLRDRQTPTVVVDRRVKGWKVDMVIGDSLGGARVLVKHLISLGHRRIAVISGPQTTSSAEDRVIGYQLAFSQAGIPIDERLIRRGEFRSSSGEALTQEILDEGLSPTAIFATNTAIALGCIATLGQRGLRIPQDIALVCFDDFPYLSQVFPFLTVVVQPVYEMGSQAAQLLLDRLQGVRVYEPCQIVLPTYLIVRYSCGSHGNELSLPIVSGALPEEWIPVPALTGDEQREVSRHPPGIPLPASSQEGGI